MATTSWDKRSGVLRSRAGAGAERPEPDARNPVPADAEVRNAIRQATSRLSLDPRCLPSYASLSVMARELLADLNQPASFSGFTMVELANAFWQSQLAAVPFDQRLLVLPGTVEDACQGEMPCESETPRCVACALAAIERQAVRLGYQVARVDRSSQLVDAIVESDVRGLLGVASLDLLEEALDRVLSTGLPALAAPLFDPSTHGGACDWPEMLARLEARREAPASPVRTYVHLLRAATRMFQPAEMSVLAPRLHAPRADGALVPLTGTEALAHEFLAKGGKHSRPFITLAVFDALTGGNGARADGDAHLAALPLSVRRAAMSIETFHKASLVHDDIEDDDAFRYGEPTLHRRLGTPTAINVGDYLIGLGYRLVSGERHALGDDVTAAILDLLAVAHLRLSEGQGAELLWRDAGNKQVSPDEALEIYALKTAPAFEAALLMGSRLAGHWEPFDAALRAFARSLGVAFQILNDLKDWDGDSNNKLDAGGDVLGGRPTLLWALALERLPAPQRERLLTLGSAAEIAARDRVDEVRRLYEAADVFRLAEQLVKRLRHEAAALAEGVDSPELRKLLVFLIEMVLERPGRAG